MCGIAAFFARESAVGYSHLNTLFEWAEKRGKDGFGLVVIRKSPRTHKRFVAFIYRNSKPYSQCKDEVFEKYFMQHDIKIGDLIIAISRAAPETEGETDENRLIETLQPIVNMKHGLVVVHNGAVSNSIYQNLKNASGPESYQFITDIDSEAILAAYVIHQRDMKRTMEFLSGGFASIVYDAFKDMLYVVNDFKPIAHGYVKGVGFFLHSDNDAIGEVIEKITSCKRDGIAMWESWYHHYLSGGRIKEIDLDSGFMRNIKYSPRFITQGWDSNFGVIVKPKGDKIIDSIDAEVLTNMVNHVNKENDSLCLVAASGGLDSTLTLAMLKMAGYKNIVPCHFNYGHRGSDAEELAIKLVCEELSLPLQIFDLTKLMKSIDTSSMLIDKDAEITTGTKQGLKKLDAWVNLRNTQFLTWMATYAESQVMKYDYKNVYFLGGFLNLSESGHYPDNSEYFIQTFLEHLKYGSLIGNRVQPLYGLANIMKHELFVLIKEFNLQKLYGYTISCDRPTIETPVCDHTLINTLPQNSINGVACNCMKNGIPACGSGLLSYWGSKMVGMDDMKMRNFYEIPTGTEYEAYVPDHLKQLTKRVPDVQQIIDRILFPPERLNNLRKALEQRKIKGCCNGE